MSAPYDKISELLKGCSNIYFKEYSVRTTLRWEPDKYSNPMPIKREDCSIIIECYCDENGEYKIVFHSFHLELPMLYMGKIMLITSEWKFLEDNIVLDDEDNDDEFLLLLVIQETYEKMKELNKNYYRDQFMSYMYSKPKKKMYAFLNKKKMDKMLENVRFCMSVLK